jgi:hypothetical protein
MKSSLTSPDWTKVFKDNYRKYSVPTGAGANDTTTVKVPVFERGSLKAALYWRKQFQDLIELKNLDAAAEHSYLRCWTREVAASPSQSPRQSSS